MTIREGSIIRVDTATKKGRPGVVVDTLPDGQVVVLWGTGTLRPHLSHVAVAPREPAGRALGLTKPTYFYGSNVWKGLPESKRLHEQPGTCPRYLLIALHAIALE